MLAVFYAACVLAPSASFAFGDGISAAHCLTDGNDHGLRAMHIHQPATPAHEHSAAAVHSHPDGTSHVHQKQSDEAKSGEQGKKSDGKCCGLMCVPALAAGVADGNLPDLPRSSTVAAAAADAAGQPAVRLDRPPNSPPSL